LDSSQAILNYRTTWVTPLGGSTGIYEIRRRNSVTSRGAQAGDHTAAQVPHVFSTSSGDDLEEVFGRVRQLPHPEVVDDEQGHGRQLGEEVVARATDRGIVEVLPKDVRLAIQDAVPPGGELRGPSACLRECASMFVWQA
jgi:hypothetical protein